MAVKSTSNEPTFLETMYDVIRLAKSTTGNISLVDISKHARVEPIAIVNKNLLKIKEYDNIVNGILNIYLGYYLQAIQLLNVYFTDAKVLKALDSVSPDRSFIVESFGSKSFSLEDSKFELPGMREDSDSNDVKYSTLNSKIDHIDRMVAVGKTIEITFNLEDDIDVEQAKQVTIPVTIRLLSMLVDDSVIAAIATSNEDEISFSSRLKDALSGRIRFFKDFILVQDLIKKQKKIIFKDGADAYNDILKRYNNSAMLTILNRGNVGYGKISSIYIMSDADEDQIRRKFGTGLNSEKIRQMVFDNTLAMIIAVVDTEWERVTIYVRDTTGYSQNTFAEFKSMKDKDSTAQLGDIIKSLMMGNAATI